MDLFLYEKIINISILTISTNPRDDPPPKERLLTCLGLTGSLMGPGDLDPFILIFLLASAKC